MAGIGVTPPFEVRAIAAYAARNNAEVSLEVGKTYTVLQTDGKDLWWQTRSETGVAGWFPASYTEVISSQPAPEPQVYAAPPQQQQYQINTVQAQASTQSTSTAPQTARTLSEKPPSPRVKQEEKGNKPQVYVKLQLVQAKIPGESKKTNSCAMVFRRKLPGDSKGTKLFKTKQAKATSEPKWNEMFQINVSDPESEVIVVKIMGKGKKDLIGEISFPLRAAVRDFDQPNYKYKWYALTGGKSGEKGGEALIYIEFFDTRQNQAPSNFRHESHVGWTAEGGFDINNIPAEWKKIFKSVGIRKQDLENNSAFANQVFSIMNEQPAEGFSDNIQAGYENIPTPPVESGYSAPPVMGGPAPPPPPPVSSGPAPPPPPPAGGGGPKAPPAPRESAAPAPAPPSGGGGGGGGGMSFLDQIKAGGAQGGFALKKVDPSSVENKPPASTGNTLADTLKAAMVAHRKDIEGNDDGDGPDDWGNDDDWDD